MAYTRIHAIKATIDKSAAYICNPDKTEGNLLVSSFSCSPETAKFDFKTALSKTSSKDVNLAYHLIQSFAPGEVSDEEAHRIINILKVILNPPPAFQILVLKNLLAVFAGFHPGFLKVIISTLVKNDKHFYLGCRDNIYNIYLLTVWLAQSEILSSRIKHPYNCKLKIHVYFQIPLPVYKNP